MHQLKISRNRVAVLGFFVASALVGCTREEGTFNATIAQQMTRAHAADIPSAELRPLPQKLESPYLPASTQPATGPSYSAATQPAPTTRPVRRMSLQQLVKAAVAHNADARVTAFQPGIDQARVVEAEAAYDLKFFTNFQFANQDNLYPTANNPLSDPFRAPILFKDMQIQTGFKQDTPTGGTVQLQYQTDQFDRATNLTNKLNNGLSSTNDPFWVNSLQLQIKQPLLQNFGAAANEARIAIAKNTQKVSALDFRIQLEKSLSDLEKAYWQLVEAEQDVKIRESLLGSARDTANLLSKRQGSQGTTYTEVSQADAAVRSREFDLLASRAQVDKLSTQIKALVNDPDMPVSGGELILPADVPSDTPIDFDTQEQIDTALAYRPELAQQQLKIDSAEITVRAAKNNELPQFDLVGQIGMDGFAHQFDAAVRDQLRFDFIDYTLGFQFQFAIGNREARAITERTQLQRLQAITQYRGLVDKITAEVHNAQVDVEASWNQIVAGRKWRLAAQESLRRLEIDEKNKPEGMSPSFIQTKLDAQDRYAEAQRQEINAIATYNVSLSALEQAKGTLLRYDNVTLEEDPQPTVPLTWHAPDWKVWKR